MKIIFLDFDGVLNSRRFLARLASATDDAIDPDAVARVNRIIAHTSAKVVISSSWRLTDSLERIVAILRAHGFSGEVIGVTPVVGQSRGHEIKAWLDENRGVTSYVILDDATDMDRLGGRHVLTDEDDGLLDEHVEAACRILSRRRWWPWPR